MFRTRYNYSGETFVFFFKPVHASRKSTVFLISYSGHVVFGKVNVHEPVQGISKSCEPVNEINLLFQSEVCEVVSILICEL